MSSDLGAEVPLQLGQDQHTGREVEQLFRRLVELTPDAVFLHGLDGRFLYANDAACDILGYTRDEFLSMCPWDFVVNDSRRRSEGKGLRPILASAGGRPVFRPDDLSHGVRIGCS